MTGKTNYLEEDFKITDGDLVLYKTQFDAERLKEYLSLFENNKHQTSQREEPLEYTLDLDWSRYGGDRENFLIHLRENFNPFLGRSILEIGPGGKNFLYNALRPIKVNWTAVEICEEVVKHLESQSLPRDYSLIHGSFYDFHERDLRFDTVVGSSSLDSITDFKSVGKSLSHVLSKGGRLIHSQDLGPSPSTIFSLLSEDPDFIRENRADIYIAYLNEEYFGITNISVGDKQLVPSNFYMHSQLARQFEKFGFVKERNEMITFTDKSTSQGSLANIVLRRRSHQILGDSRELPPTCKDSDSFAFMVLKKT